MSYLTYEQECKSKKAHIFFLLKKQRYSTYANLFALVPKFDLTSDPKCIGCMNPETKSMKINRTISDDLTSTVVRHEILHDFLRHQLRMIEHIGKGNYDARTAKLHRIMNIAMDYEISNKAYTEHDKELLRKIEIGGRLVKALVTEDKHPDWVNWSMEQMYDELTKMLKDDQQKGQQEQSKSKDKNKDKKDRDSENNQENNNNQSDDSEDSGSESQDSGESSSDSEDTDEGDSDGGEQSEGDDSNDDSDENGSDGQDSDEDGSNDEDTDDKNGKGKNSDDEEPDEEYPDEVYPGGKSNEESDDEDDMSDWFNDPEEDEEDSNSSDDEGDEDEDEDEKGKPKLGDSGDDDYQEKERQEREKADAEARERGEVDDSDRPEDALPYDELTPEERAKKYNDAISNVDGKFIDDERKSAQEAEDNAERIKINKDKLAPADIKLKKDLADAEYAVNPTHCPSIQALMDEMTEFLTNYADKIKTQYMAPGIDAVRYYKYGIGGVALGVDRTDEIPQIDMYFDLSSSWANYIPLAEYIYSELKQLEEEHIVKINQFYFSTTVEEDYENIIYRDKNGSIQWRSYDDYDQGWTYGQPILNNLHETQADNVFIFTDSDITDCRERLTVNGAVWLLFRGTYSPKLGGALRGEQLTRQYVMSQTQVDSALRAAGGSV